MILVCNESGKKTAFSMSSGAVHPQGHGFLNVSTSLTESQASCYKVATATSFKAQEEGKSGGSEITSSVKKDDSFRDTTSGLCLQNSLFKA